MFVKFHLFRHKRVGVFRVFPPVALHGLRDPMIRHDYLPQQ